jgi:hypothetical protein
MQRIPIGLQHMWEGMTSFATKTSTHHGNTNATFENSLVMYGQKSLQHFTGTYKTKKDRHL